MPGTQQNQTRKTATFGDDGEEIDSNLESAAEEVEEPQTDDADEELEGEETETTEETLEEPAPKAKSKAKYRIGDQEFETMEEAHAYATAQANQTDDNDAYRRLVNELIQAPAQTESVTPAEDEIDEVQLFENPKEFLKQYGQKIQQQTVQAIQQTSAQEAESNRIWREFTDRHPALADFRNEAEAITGRNLKVVQKLVQTKGAAAAYDFIALEMRRDFARKAEALKPGRALSNKGGTTTPSQKTTSVTPKAPAKKPLSFAEQIRSIKKRK